LVPVVGKLAMALRASLSRMCNSLPKTIEMSDCVVAIAADRYAPLECFCNPVAPLDAENVLHARLVAAVHSRVHTILRISSQPQIAKPVIRTISVNVIDLQFWIFVMSKCPRNPMNTKHFSIKANLQVTVVK